MTKDTQLNLTTKQAQYCVTYSRMTVKNEADSSSYWKVQFVELLEMIGRIADTKFRDTDDESTPLHDKIVLALDDILPCFGLKVRLGGGDGEEESESDADY